MYSIFNAFLRVEAFSSLWWYVIHNKNNLFSLKPFLPPEAPNSCNVSSYAGYLSFVSQPLILPSYTLLCIAGAGSLQTTFPRHPCYGFLLYSARQRKCQKSRKWKEKQKQCFLFSASDFSSTAVAKNFWWYGGSSGRGTTAARAPEWAAPHSWFLLQLRQLLIGSCSSSRSGILGFSPRRPIILLFPLIQI